jgi:transposase
LVFIDETAVATNMVRRYGRAPRGQRLVCKVPFGAWTTLTFIAALRHDRITAPLLLQGAMNGQIFRAYVEQMLAPTLKPGDVVIMDNVRVHKVAGVSEAIEARGATVPSFPAYSPDLNPIELAFSKLKARLRASTARSTPRLLTAVRAALTRFSPRECTAYLAHAGYRSNLIENGSKTRSFNTHGHDQSCHRRYPILSGQFPSGKAHLMCHALGIMSSILRGN